MHRLVLGHLILLAGVCSMTAGCTRTPEPGPSPSQTEPAVENGLEAAVAPPIEPLGIFVSARGAQGAVFVPWVDDGTVNRAIAELKNTDGGEVRFAPGTYTIRRIVIRNVDNVTVKGVPGVKLIFPEAKAEPPRLVEPALPGDTRLVFDHPVTLLPQARYQLLNDDGFRHLEFTVKSTDGPNVTPTRPIRPVLPYPAVPAGAILFEEFNFFHISGANNVTIQGLEIDGANLGTKDAHTIYSGVLSRNKYVPNNTKRSSVTGLRVLDNTFRNLAGRGVAVYSAAGVLVEGNRFVNVRSQSVEVDHYSSGRIINNNFTDCRVGIVLDDAYDTVVKGNRMVRCGIGVGFVRHFDDEWVNRDVTVEGNTITGPGNIGIRVDELVDRNNIGENVITGMNRKVR